uniref:Uncharacterized protein n=1 Tax=Setaria digitata TaxID=48799 RepID=A0A915PVT1_9BILA
MDDTCGMSTGAAKWELHLALNICDGTVLDNTVAQGLGPRREQLKAKYESSSKWSRAGIGKAELVDLVTRVNCNKKRLRSENAGLLYMMRLRVGRELCNCKRDGYVRVNRPDIIWSTAATAV